MMELEKLIMELYKNTHNLLRFSSPMKAPRRLGGPQNRSGRRGEEKNLVPARNPTPAVHPYVGQDATDIGVITECTPHLFFTLFQSSIASFNRTCFYQPHPPAVRFSLRGRSSRCNGSLERTPRKTPPDPYLKRTHYPFVGPLP
jgi:hypothetical protein